VTWLSLQTARFPVGRTIFANGRSSTISNASADAAASSGRSAIRVELSSGRVGEDGRFLRQSHVPGKGGILRATSLAN